MRRMNDKLQMYGIGRMLSNTRAGENFDLIAHLDRTLSFGENTRNIQRIAGISTRDRGTEILAQRDQELQRERLRRKDVTRQTGRIQNQHNLELDKKLRAKYPGRRTSAGGHRYTERRANRSDVNPRERL